MKEKRIEARAPDTQRIKAISLRGISLKAAESCMTVEAASKREKAESIPKVKRVMDRIKAQALDPGIVSMAAG